MKNFTFISLLFCNAVCAAAQTPPPSSAPPDSDVTVLEPVTVTGTREKALLSETPASVGAISTDNIRETAPLHPGQILGRIPGVAVAVTNGEGHTTAIRQPFTSSPVYLFLEDGIPVRATGFFNHNALYETNLRMAGGIEVVRGPGTALHGSDAVGGIINILSRAPSRIAHWEAGGEFGSFGTWRGLAGGGGALGETGAFDAGVNITHTDGWRDRTAYDRQSANLRIDQPAGRGGLLKTIASVSRIDQQTGANSPLTLGDYENDPARNLMPVAYRKVSAVRVSSEYQHTLGANLLSFIGYFRDNAMELNGSYNLAFDPRIERTHNVSCGFMAKWRRTLPFWRARVIAGVDFDHSPGSRREDNLLLTRSGSGANTSYTGYATGTRIYDYRVTFQGLSPYVHAEFSPASRLRVTAGMRYDMLGFDMTNRLPEGVVQANVNGASRYYGQLPGDERHFYRASPKLGVTYAITPRLHLRGSYNTGFRIPSESQLYRAGNDAGADGALARARLSRELRPIKAGQAEIGLRAEIASWSCDLAAYNLVKRDDLVSQRDLATNAVVSVNAGKTEHRGIEAGIGGPLFATLRLDAALSYSRQRYVDWTTATASFSGKDIEAAPRTLGSARLTWRPAAATSLQLEWTHVGSYWLEASNSAVFGKYNGHDLLNLRASHALTKHISLFARVMNVAGKRFADSASVSSSTPVFSPGLPRAFYGSIEMTW